MKPASSRPTGPLALLRGLLGSLLFVIVAIPLFNVLTSPRAVSPVHELPPEAPRLSAPVPGEIVPAGIGPARARVVEAERRHGAGHPEVADALELLAQRLWLVGDLAAERPVVERALAIRRGWAELDEAAIARTLHFLAELQRAEGDYGAALQTREDLEPILRRVYGPEHPEMAVHLHALAIIEEATGDIPSALRHARRSMEIREESLDAADPLLAVSSNFVGHLLVLTGEIAEAEPLVRRAVSIWEGALGADHPDVARGLSNMGMLLEAKGQLVRARPFMERALAIRSKAFGPRHILVARSFAQLGSLERRLGRAGTARALLERAVEIQERASVPSHPELAASLRELAGLSLEEGRSRPALALALRAEEISRDHFLLTSGGLSEREALSHARGRTSDMDVAMRAAASLAAAGEEDPQAARSALDVLVRSRALVLDVMAARRRNLSLHSDGETAALAASLRRVRSRIAQLLLEDAIQDPSDPLTRRLLEARQDADRLERALAEKSREFRREQAREHVGIAEVAASLPLGSALVSYAKFEPGRERSGRSAEAGYLAFVWKAGAAAPAIVPLGEAEEIDAAVASWRRVAAANPHLEGSVVAEASCKRAGRRLAEAIWDPLAGALGGSGSVFVVPDGTLHQVAFAALVGPEGSYLLETGPLVHNLVAERDLAGSEESMAPGHGLLALGDPDFDSHPAAGAAAASRRGGTAARRVPGFRFVPLPGARSEAEEVAAAWKGEGRATVLTGSRASEASFKRLAPGSRILHLGTHAFFESAARITPPAAAENPLRLSGLALAGANAPPGRLGGGAEDDGILTSEEIATMDLGGVEWAVLSACETGGGDVEAWEGILGLHRAFRIAGARTLITSLWPVEDEATRHFMLRLYAARGEGMSASQAIRRASLDLLESQRRLGRTTHPYYWGGFVAAGDGR